MTGVDGWRRRLMCGRLGEGCDTEGGDVAITVGGGCRVTWPGLRCRWVRWRVVDERGWACTGVVAAAGGQRWVTIRGSDEGAEGGTLVAGRWGAR